MHIAHMLVLTCDINMYINTLTDPQNFFFLEIEIL